MHISICAYAASEPFATFTIDIALRGDFRNTKPKAVILGGSEACLAGLWREAYQSLGNYYFRKYMCYKCDNCEQVGLEILVDCYYYKFTTDIPQHLFLNKCQEACLPEYTNSPK